MATDPISGLGGAQTASQNAAGRLSSDYQSFLKLLTAQLSNQDPLEPMDSSTFVTQLAQLSQVEQAITTNSNLELISTQLTNASLLADMAMIGRTVTVPTATLQLSGEASFSYSVAPGAKSVKAEILSADNQVVRTFEDLPIAAGELHRVDWDGLDKVGLPVPDGSFKVKLTALDAEGEALAAASYGTATVQRVSFESGTAMLALDNGEEVYSAQVLMVE